MGLRFGRANTAEDLLGATRASRLPACLTIRFSIPGEFDGGFPPPLMIVEGQTEAEVLAALESQARDDRMVAGLMREKGLR